MPTTIYIPTPLRPYTGQREAVEAEGATVGALLADLVARYPELKRHLYAEDGRLRSFVNVYLNEQDIRHLAREATPVAPGDTVTIVPSVAGGHPAPASARGEAEALPALAHDEIRRYSRHLIMPEVGLDGQRRLKAARVLCIGAGGLGSPATLYLAAAGVGTIGLVDFDVVDFSNLQRQILHGTPDVGRPKLESARDRLTAVNPHVRLELHETRLTSANALEIVAGYDLVVDGTDNFPTRYLVNDACVLLGKPNVYGSIFRFEGQASIFAAPGGPCYRCLYPEPPPPGLVPSCAEGGVLGVLPGIVGTIQATEAIKLILGAGSPLIGRLLVFDALGMRFREFTLQRDPACPVCGTHPTIRALIDYEEFCGVGPRHAVETGAPEVTARELAALLDGAAPPVLVDVREPHEARICRIPGARLIPLGELPRRLAELDSTRRIVVHCRSGQRSARAVMLLRDAGFDAWNLKGGILAWIDEVDPTQPKY
jgi:molybdopterin/thiamine biosynthesis adenylyltransferase/rhodanese-related sulfurtransferase/molybdopterin converting factor small subunit